jgi:hypothetical protein
LPPWVADRAELLLTGAPRRSDGEAESRSLIAEEDPEWHKLTESPAESTPTPDQQLATALRDLDLDAMTPRQALTWLWEQQERLLGEVNEP